MKKILFLSLVALGSTAFAASNNFKVDLFQNSVVNGKTLKAGEYKISMENGNAVIRNHKGSIEVPAHEVTLAKKAQSTALTYLNNTDLQAIRVGGTRTQIVFGPSTATHNGM